MRRCREVTFYHDIEQDVNVPAEMGACRDAVRALLDIEARLGVRTTYNIVGSLWRDQPEIVGWIREGGHEVAFHSWHHELECPPEQYASEVRRCRDFSTEPTGYRSPRSRWNEDTLEALRRERFWWSAESDLAPAPYLIRPGLVRLPIAGDDWPLHTGGMDESGWTERFEQRLDERDYVAVGVHDCVVCHAPEPRLDAWARCIEAALEAGAAVRPFRDVASDVLEARS